MNIEKRKTRSEKRNVKDVFRVSLLASRFSLFGSVAVVAFCGCSKYYYNPAPQVLPAHIARIAVRPFANHTQQYGLEDKLTLAVQSEFNRDGRYQITTEEQADGVVIGDI